MMHFNEFCAYAVADAEIPNLHDASTGSVLYPMHTEGK